MTHGCLIDELGELQHADLALPVLVETVGDVIARAVPYDSACWHTLDPTTLIETSAHLQHLPADSRGASEIEYLRADVNKFAVLARSPRHSGILSDATGGRPSHSLRYRSMVAPHGLEGELRTSFVADGGCWGSVGLFRAAPEDFAPDEADALHAMSDALGRAFRAAALRGAHGADAPDAPGLVLFDGERRVEAVTPAARRWLVRLGWEAAAGDDALPYAVYTVADSARRPDCTTAAARARAQNGGWVMLHASAAAGHADDYVAVILQGLRPVANASLLAYAYRLSRRECDVTELVLDGASTADVAARLAISPYTVQEHLKAIFGKVGVHSRRELVAHAVGCRPAFRPGRPQ